MTRILTKKLLVLTSLAILSGSAAPQDSGIDDWIRNPAMGNYKAYAEFKMAHYEAARHIWEILAGLGNTDALFNLGILAEDGLGEEKDMNKAVALYTAAASAGGFKARYRLGVLYSVDGPAGKDLGKARHYLTLAAEQGDKDAAARLATLGLSDLPQSEFEQAELLASNGYHAEAAALYGRLAEAGDRTARTRLAWMYEAGRGVSRDLVEAARLFKESAEAGDPEAQFAIAVMYRTGKGQPQDLEQAMAWLRRSAEQRYPAAMAALAAETETK